MMKRVLSFAAAFAISTLCLAQTNTYSATLKKYLVASGSLESFKMVIPTMISSFKGMKTSVPDQFWKDMEEELSKTTMDDLLEQLTPVYKKHLTETDLNEVIKFYNSPIGKKLAEKTPGITNDSMQAGQVWGQKIAAQLLTRLKEKGY